MSHRRNVINFEIQKLKFCNFRSKKRGVFLKFLNQYKDESEEESRKQNLLVLKSGDVILLIFEGKQTFFIYQFSKTD